MFRLEKGRPRRDKRIVTIFSCGKDASKKERKKAFPVFNKILKINYPHNQEERMRLKVRSF